MFFLTDVYVQKHYFGGENLFFVRSTFSCVRASYDLCASAHAHSLEGTLARTPLVTPQIVKEHSGYTLLTFVASEAKEEHNRSDCHDNNDGWDSRHDP